MKDNFSHNSSNYSSFRPNYPEALFQFLKTQLSGLDNAWDCGTGTGQVALPLSAMFNSVYATDISTSQLANAPQRKNIYYSKQPAEKTNFEPDKFDLITVGQAIHWFDFEKFYAEVNRTIKINGIIAIIGYGLLKTTNGTQNVILDLYHNILGPFWDPERKFIDENYSTIPFPFREISSPRFEYKVQWSFEHLIGYLKTWSAVKHYKDQEGYDPVDQINPILQDAFGVEGEITFPILLRVGKKN